MEWIKKKNGIPRPRIISGTAFLPSLYALFGWKKDCKYRIIGVKRGHGAECILLFNLKETEIFIPNDVLQEQTAETPKAALRPFTDNIKRNIMAYPPDWVDTFGSNFYSHAQAQELAGFDKDSSWNISEQAVPYKDSELQVTSRPERDKNIEQIMSDMKEATND